ncbi:MAG: Integrase catalytic region [Paenibacillus sp.]|jgi:hypothetical protein|nr:Integrase catalytic region [Paenibacillus sp.]
MLTIRSVIEWVGESEKKNKLERILWVSSDRSEVVVISLEEVNPLPRFIDTSSIEEALADGRALKRTVDPYVRLKKPDPVKDEKEYKKRDYYWSLVEHMVHDEPDIYDPKLRAALIKEVAEKRKVKYNNVLKYLRRYWRYGMIRDALFQENERKGGAKETRAIVTEVNRSQSKFQGRGGKRGRRSRLEKHDGKVGKSVTPEDEAIFHLAYQKFFKEEKLPLTKAYDKMLRSYYNIGNIEKNGVKVPILPPKGERHTFKQFSYWVHKNEDIKKTLIARLGSKKFNLQSRAVIGSMSHMADGPGKLYQVDSTIVDLFLLSSHNFKIIGKPVLYVVSDTFSRRVVGFYVGLEGPNWEGYAMALANAFENKREFCSKYGIEITSDEWDCTFKPDQILCDRGSEFIGKNSDMLSDSLGIHVSNAAPYRADWKSIVERTFGLLNDSVIHWLAGSTQGRKRERGERAPEKDAVLTLHDFTKILILTMLEHNHSHWIDSYPLTKEMIRDEVNPIPDEMWNWGIGNSGVLTEVEPRIARLNLMPIGKATVHREGIKFKGMYYSSKTAIEERWFERAHQSGSFQIPVSYDRRFTDVIYFIDDKGEPIACEMLPRDKESYLGFRLEEVEEFFASKKLRHDRHDEEQSKAIRDAQIDDTLKAAKKRKEAGLKEQPQLSKTEQTKVSKEDRNLVKELNQTAEKFDLRDKKHESSAGDLLPMPDKPWQPRQSKEKNALSLLKKRRILHEG